MRIGFTVESMPRCEWCGEQGSSEEPLRETVTTPPVDGYEADIALLHDACARQAARAAVT